MRPGVFLWNLIGLSIYMEKTHLIMLKSCCMESRWWELTRQRMEKAWEQISATLAREEDLPYKISLNQWFSVSLDEDLSIELSMSDQVYYQLLFDELGDRDLNEELPLFSPLMETLIYLNFNEPQIVKQKLSDWDLELSTTTDKKRKVGHWKALLAQLPVQTEYALYPGRRTFRDQMEQWLGTQLYDLESSSDEAPEPVSPVKKVEAGCSVDMLALIGRCFYERKVFPKTSKAELARVIISIFSTRRQPDISEESLYHSFHHPLPGTIKMARECLKEIDKFLASLQ